MNQLDYTIDNCKTLNSLTNSFIQMNRELNNLAELNITTINNIILPNQTIKTIKSMLGNTYALPYELNYLNFDQFLANINFKFYHSNYTITLAFEIPFYIKTLLYSIFPKPILIKDTPYILNTKEKYAAIVHHKPIFFNETNFFEFCFFKANTFFCMKPNNNRNCEKDIVLYTKTRKQCLTKLPKRNIITRIKDTIYLTVFKPIIFQVKFPTNTYFIKIINHSIFTNEHNCQLKSSSYNFNSDNFTTSYELHISDIPDNHDFLFSKHNDLIYFNLYLTLSYLIFIITLHLLTLLIIT